MKPSLIWGEVTVHGLIIGDLGSAAWDRFSAFGHYRSQGFQLVTIKLARLSEQATLPDRASGEPATQTFLLHILKLSVECFTTGAESF